MLKSIFGTAFAGVLLCTVLLIGIEAAAKSGDAPIITAIVNTRQAYVSETAHFQLIDIDRSLRIKVYPDVEELLDVALWSPRTGILLTREITPDLAIFRLYRYDILNGKQTLLHQATSPDRNRSFNILSDYTVQLSHQQDQAALYDPVTAKLYVIDLNTGDFQQVFAFNQMISFPILLWSPDDTQLAFRQDYQSLMVVNADGSNPRTFNELAVHEVYPVWSADNTQLLLSPAPVPAGAMTRIRIIDAQTGESPPNLPFIEGRNSLWCNEDNRLLAFARQQDKRLEVIDLETGESQVFPVPLEVSFSAQLFPFPIAWMPDCSGLIFRMFIDSGLWMVEDYLYYADRASGETRLVSDPVSIVDFEENGALIVYQRESQLPYTLRLYRLSTDDFQKTPIGSYYYNGDWLVWSADFSMALFTGQNGGAGRLGLLHINSNETRFLTGQYEFALAYRLWD